MLHIIGKNNQKVAAASKYFILLSAAKLEVENVLRSAYWVKFMLYDARDTK